MPSKNDKGPDKELRRNLISAEDFVEYRRNVLWTFWGGTGIGKTYLILSCPKPIFLLSCEPEGVYKPVKNAITDGVIKPNELFIDEVIRSALGGDANIVRTVEEEREIFDYVLDQVRDLIKTERQGTLAIDTGTSLWTITDEVEGEAIREKRKKQGKDELFRFDYRYANRSFRHIIDAIRASDLNCIISHHDKPVYNAQGQATKRREYSGNNALDQWSDLHFKLSYTPSDDKKDRRWVTIEKCREDAGVIGLEVDLEYGANPFDVIYADVEDEAAEIKAGRQTVKA
tara:strand:- start:865 stop:1722 length:858 start_codon:yes stop_codon:yes gene_type:complete